MGEFSLKITTITSECLGVPLGAGGGGGGGRGYGHGWNCLMHSSKGKKETRKNKYANVPFLVIDAIVVFCQS